ncbi:hypothetical protein BN1013_00393 [Candidatus Rubidus massiliensis]|nr:MAG: hypothetical protein BGO10_02540 [Chlamydia sp. 32-24]CDZ79892.1 hypothetical protein BN1013_00393 [Candidatus Rubidus massiliensis]
MKQGSLKKIDLCFLRQGKAKAWVRDSDLQLLIPEVEVLPKLNSHQLSTNSNWKFKNKLLKNKIKVQKIAVFRHMIRCKTKLHASIKVIS